MVSKEDLLIKQALQQPAGSGEPFVEIFMDGEKKQVPASVGTYLLTSTLSQLVQQLILRVDGVHHHLAQRAHPKSSEIQTCPMCVAREQARQMIVEEKEDTGDPGPIETEVTA